MGSHTDIHTHVHTHNHTHTCSNTQAQAHRCMCTLTGAYTHSCSQLHAYTLTCTYMFMHSHSQMHILTIMDTHAHMLFHVPVPLSSCSLCLEQPFPLGGLGNVLKVQLLWCPLQTLYLAPSTSSQDPLSCCHPCHDSTCPSGVLYHLSMQPSPPADCELLEGKGRGQRSCVPVSHHRAQYQDLCRPVVVKWLNGWIPLLRVGVEMLGCAQSLSHTVLCFISNPDNINTYHTAREPSPR